MSNPSQSRSSVGLTRRQPEKHRQIIVPPIVNTARQHQGTSRQRMNDGEQARLAGELRLDTGYKFEELIPDLSGRKRIFMFSADQETRIEPEECVGEAAKKNSLFSRSPTPAPDDPGPLNDCESVQIEAEAIAIAALLDMQQGKDDISDLPDVMISFHPTMPVSPFVPTAPTEPGTPATPRSTWARQVARIKSQLEMRLTPHPEEEVEDAV